MTTLTEARKALLKLLDSFPPQSTYTTLAATVADYLDKQVPLNIENKALRAQLAAQGGSSMGRVGRVTPLVKLDAKALSVSAMIAWDEHRA